MQKLIWTAVAVALIASAAQATVYVSDNFDRPDGNLVGTMPTVGPSAWAAHSGSNGPVQISGGKINILQDASATHAQDVNVPTGVTMGAGDVQYAGFDLTMTQQGTSIANAYFAHWLTGTSMFTERLWVTAPVASGYRLVLTNGSGAITGGAYSNDLVLGETYRIVMSYDYSAMTGKLWINPTDETSPALAPTDPGYSNAAIAFAFRQGSPTTSLTTTQTIDNLFVGNSWLAAYNGTPEPATLALLGLGGLLLRRRR